MEGPKCGCSCGLLFVDYDAWHEHACRYPAGTHVPRSMQSAPSDGTVSRSSSYETSGYEAAIGMSSISARCPSSPVSQRVAARSAGNHVASRAGSGIRMQLCSAVPASAAKSHWAAALPSHVGAKAGAPPSSRNRPGSAGPQFSPPSSPGTPEDAARRTDVGSFPAPLTTSASNSLFRPPSRPEFSDWRQNSGDNVSVVDGAATTAAAAVPGLLEAAPLTLPRSGRFGPPRAPPSVSAAAGMPGRQQRQERARAPYGQAQSASPAPGRRSLRHGAGVAGMRNTSEDSSDEDAPPPSVAEMRRRLEARCADPNSKSSNAAPRAGRPPAEGKAKESAEVIQAKNCPWDIKPEKDSGLADRGRGNPGASARNWSKGSTSASSGASSSAKLVDQLRTSDEGFSAEPRRNVSSLQRVESAPQDFGPRYDDKLLPAHLPPRLCPSPPRSTPSPPRSTPSPPRSQPQVSIRVVSPPRSRLAATEIRNTPSPPRCRIADDGLSPLEERVTATEFFSRAHDMEKLTQEKLNQTPVQTGSTIQACTPLPPQRLPSGVRAKSAARTPALKVPQTSPACGSATSSVTKGVRLNLSQLEVPPRDLEDRPKSPSRSLVSPARDYRFRSVSPNGSCPPSPLYTPGCRTWAPCSSEDAGRESMGIVFNPGLQTVECVETDGHDGKKEQRYSYLSVPDVSGEREVLTPLTPEQEMIFVTAATVATPPLASVVGPTSLDCAGGVGTQSCLTAASIPYSMALATPTPWRNVTRTDARADDRGTCLVPSQGKLASVIASSVSPMISSLPPVASVAALPYEAQVVLPTMGLSLVSAGEIFTRFLVADSAAAAMATLQALVARCEEEPGGNGSCSSTCSVAGLDRPCTKIRRMKGLPWKAQSLWKLQDDRFSQTTEYKAAPLKGSQAVVCGSGPCGLRAALELSLLGAQVTVVEKRAMGEAFNRINRVHLWEWCKQDLMAWGAKVFDPPGGTFGGDNDFCHIGIGELQMLLLKNALLLGVQFRFGAEAQGIEGGALICRDGARYVCDTLVLAGGASSPLIHTLGLKAQVIGLRGKGSAIGVVANFVNNRDTAQQALRQFSWARQFNIPLFEEVKEKTGANLENIVYYKGPTHHYVVMTPTKRSLLDTGVLRDGQPAAVSLLHGSNVNIHKLADMVQSIGAFFKLPTQLTQSQGAMIFDFSGVKRLEAPAAVVDGGCRGDGMFCCAVGDALLEPFWPEGLGIMRGFMSALDAAAAAVKAYTESKEEAIMDINTTYNVLKSVAAQSASQCLQKDLRQYRLRPGTRYLLSGRR